MRENREVEREGQRERERGKATTLSGVELTDENSQLAS